MTKAADPKGYDRRRFLRGLAGAGATTTVLVVAGRAVGSTEAPLTEQGGKPSEAPKGYRLTPHIKTYYDKAQF